MTFRWEGNLEASLQGMDQKIERGMIAAAHWVAPQAEQYMKQNAPWTDQTGAARNGLRTKVESGDGKVAIILYHSVPYGVWLEVRHGGTYAIIEPAMAYAAPLFGEALQRMAFGGVT